MKTFGLWDPSITPLDLTPVQFARDVGLLDISSILAHVNYVTDADIELLAASRAAVAYCPLAHQYFQHAPHRYLQMIETGVNIVLGNDSLACSEQLSILAQMQAVFQAGSLAAEQVFAMGTTAAAKALAISAG